MGLKMTDMFHDEPAKLTVSDAWTLIHPEVAKRNIKFNRTIADIITQDGGVVGGSLPAPHNFTCHLSVFQLHVSRFA